MNYEEDNESIFLKGRLADSVAVWNRVAIALLDIRHNRIASENPVKNYCFPASAFLYVCSGKAFVSLDDISYQIECFGVFHGGKGTLLSIFPQSERLEYYIILYKAVEPPFYKRELVKLMAENNPFKQHYGFIPDNPVFFSELLRKMHEAWKKPVPLELFYGKVAFYQFVYEVYKELDKGEVLLLPPDAATMAKRYIDSYYGEPISIQSMAEIFNMSYSQFHRRFTSQIGMKPQEYLIHTRLSHVKEYLVQTDMTLKEIAKACGFVDEFRLMRIFKNAFHITATEYRKKSIYNMRDFAMDSEFPLLYNEESLVRLFKLKEEGTYTMFKQMKHKAVITAVLSMMLLSACQVNTPASNNSAVTPAQSVSSTSQDMSQPEEDGTKTISTVLGDVQIPVNPQRAVIQYLMGDLYAMDITPVGVSEVYDEASFKGLSSESEDLGFHLDWNPEDVMALNPDVIIIINQNQYEEMSKIAPTIYIPYGETSIEDRLTLFGEIFNKQEKAAEVIDEYHQNIEDAKEALKNLGISDKTITILGGADAPYVAGTKYATGQLIYTTLEITAPQKVQEDVIDKDEYWGDLSMEVLEDYCGDYIIYLEAEENEIQQKLSSNTIWNLIPAVKAGHVISLNAQMLWYTDVYTINTQINMIVDELTGLSEKE